MSLKMITNTAIKFNSCIASINIATLSFDLPHRLPFIFLGCRRNDNHLYTFLQVDLEVLADSHHHQSTRDQERLSRHRHRSKMASEDHSSFGMAMDESFDDFLEWLQRDSFVLDGNKQSTQ